MKPFFAKKFGYIIFLFSCFLYRFSCSVPTLSHYDPFIFHTTLGTDKYYKSYNKRINPILRISPFYQHASGARGKCGAKVAEGDLFGRWNMFGLFFGIDECHLGTIESNNASPWSKKFVLETASGGSNPLIPNECTRTCRYPRLSEAWRALDNQDEGATEEKDGKNYQDYNKTTLDNNYTSIEEYVEENWELYFPLTYTNYEKYGLRVQFNLDFDFGLGFNVKGGLVDYKQCPEFNLSTQFQNGLGISADPDAKAVYKYLMEGGVFGKICNEVGLDVTKHQVTTFEDTHVQMFFNLPYDLIDKDNKVVAVLSPYAAFGSWIPTGQEKKQDIAFSLPTGNDGFWALTADGALNIDFPGMIQISFGLGGAWFFSRNLDNYRVPSSEFQQGIFPWKAKIRKIPGPSWYFNASLKAEDFIWDNFSIFVDYIYCQHNQDKIKMNESSDCCNQLFKPEILEELSKWKTTLIHVGLNYRISPGLDFGLSAQMHYSGERVYRNTTILGSVTLNF